MRAGRDPVGQVCSDPSPTSAESAAAEKLFGQLRSGYQQKPEARLMGEGLDLSGRRKDGTDVPLEIGLNPVGQDGKPAVLATIIDISARKHRHCRYTWLSKWTQGP